MKKVEDYVRSIPDFPEPGIIFRDVTSVLQDAEGLKLAIDIKRGVDPDKLMKKLFRMTPLQDNYSCNFNILIGGTPPGNGRL